MCSGLAINQHLTSLSFYSRIDHKFNFSGIIYAIIETLTTENKCLKFKRFLKIKYFKIILVSDTKDHYLVDIKDEFCLS